MFLLILQGGLRDKKKEKRRRYNEVLTVIFSITKFSIVIGSPRAYLSRYRRAITWV